MQSTHRAAKLAAANVGVPAPGSSPAVAKQGSERRARKHALARERILRASAELFFENGYAGTTVDAIARKLDMTKTFMYYYFKDKAEIYSTLCLDTARATLSSFDFAQRENMGTLDVLRKGLHRLAMTNMEHFQASSLYYRELQALAGDVRALILRRARSFYRRLYKLIDKGQQEGVLQPVNSRLAALSIAGVIGFMYRWYDPNGKFTRERMADELTEVMLRIAGAPPASGAAPAPSAGPGHEAATVQPAKSVRKSRAAREPS